MAVRATATVREMLAVTEFKKGDVVRNGLPWRDVEFALRRTGGVGGVRPPQSSPKQRWYGVKMQLMRGC